jgi:hypothetical protein
MLGASDLTFGLGDNSYILQEATRARCNTAAASQWPSALLLFHCCTGGTDSPQVDVSRVVSAAIRMVSEGAHILDVGGQSTRPGAPRLTTQQELGRVVPVIRWVLRENQSNKYSGCGSRAGGMLYLLRVGFWKV